MIWAIIPKTKLSIVLSQRENSRCGGLESDNETTVCSARVLARLHVFGILFSVHNYLY